MADPYPVREAAVRILGETGDTRAVGPIVRALNDKFQHIRELAAHTLRKVGGPSAVEALVRVLKHDEDTVLRYIAAKELGKSGDPRAVGPLVEAADDHTAYADQFTRIAAADALAEIGGQPAVKALGQLLQHSEAPDTRLAAAKLLGEMGEPSALGPLTEVIKDHSYSKDERVDAIHALRKIKDPQVVEVLVAVLKLSDAHDLIVAVVRVLGEIGDPRAIEPLAELLEYVLMRDYVVKALVQIGNHRAVGPLLEILKREKSLRLIKDVAWALGEFGDTRAVKLLVETLKNKYKYVTEPHHHWPDIQARRITIEALGKIGAPQAIRPLIEEAETLQHCAESAVSALKSILEMNASKIVFEDLQVLAHLNNIVQCDYEESEYGRHVVGQHSVNCLQIRQCARQQLDRRGLEA